MVVQRRFGDLYFGDFDNHFDLFEIFMKFRNKPVEIEAMRFRKAEQSPNFLSHELTEFFGDDLVVAVWEHGELVIDTLEGRLIVTDGDWIIKGVEGFSSCEPNIFEKTYEAVE